MHFDVPLVVRLEGTEVEEGRRLLAESDLNVIAATDLTDAAKKVVAAAGQLHGATLGTDTVSILVDRQYPRDLSGHHRPRRPVPRQALP